MNSSLILYLLVGVFTFLFGFSPPAFAAVIKINEFSSADNPEWVELYNLESSEVSLDGWTVLFQDNPDTTQKTTLSGGDIIPAGGFKIIERTYTGTSAWLRNDGDTIILKDATGTEQDSVRYGDVSGANVSAPALGQSAGRSSDGTGNWIIFSASTKGSSNNTSTPVPTLTPTPTPTPTPTTAPTPTKTPTQTPTKTPTPTPTLKSVSSSGSGATATPKPTSPPTSAPTKILALSSQAAGGSGNINTAVSSTATSSSTPMKSGPTKKPTPTSIKSGQTAILGVTQTNLSKILIGAGVIFLLACGILAFRAYKQYQENRKEIG